MNDGLPWEHVLTKYQFKICFGLLSCDISPSLVLFLKYFKLVIRYRKLNNCAHSVILNDHCFRGTFNVLEPIETASQIALF